MNSPVAEWLNKGLLAAWSPTHQPEAVGHEVVVLLNEGGVAHPRGPVVVHGQLDVTPPVLDGLTQQATCQRSQRSPEAVPSQVHLRNDNINRISAPLNFK